MNVNAEQKWAPITPLSDHDRATDLADIGSLYESWRAVRARFKDEGGESLEKFTDQLVRRLSIETGILERIYDLDRGTTEALVTHGFIEDLVSHGSTNIEPARLIDILRSQEAAIKLVMECVSGRRQLTKGLIHELHAVITRNQDTTTAMDQFGSRREIPLERGKYKTQPNNPRRQDQGVHEYCPPLQVEPEMDNLLAWLGSYSNDDPVIVAAWLHHRFTQIHPYQDGNGRLARTLSTLVLLRAGLLPLVVDRDLRLSYIESLEVADSGELGALALFFAKLERSAILQGLSVDIDRVKVQQRTLTLAVIDSLKAKFDKRKQAQTANFRQVNVLAVALRDECRHWIEEAFSELKGTLEEIGIPEIHALNGGPDFGNSHWYKYDVVKSGEASAKFVNFNENHYFVKATIRIGNERLVYVVSIHHVGRELTGIMEITAFARLESFGEGEERDFSSQEFFSCSLDPFVITWRTKKSDVVPTLEHWIDETIAISIKEFGDRL